MAVTQESTKELVRSWMEGDDVEPIESTSQQSPNRTPERDFQAKKSPPEWATSTMTRPMSPSNLSQNTTLAGSPPDVDGQEQICADVKEFFYGFPPPTSIQQKIDDNTLVTSAGTATTSMEFLFSPPLTRAMAKRQSLDITEVGQVVR